MTFDLFATHESATAPAPAAAPTKRTRAEGENFAMHPSGDLNRWLYRGVPVVYDARRKAGSELGLWRTVEGIGEPVIHGDDRINVCRAIDARLDSKSTP